MDDSRRTAPGSPVTAGEPLAGGRAPASPGTTASAAAPGCEEGGSTSSRTSLPQAQS